MKKHENAIKMLMKNAVDCSYYGYYESENGARYLTNGHLIIKLFNTYSTVTTDFVGDLPRLNDTNFLNKLVDFVEAHKNGDYKIQLHMSNVKMWDKYNDTDNCYKLEYDKNKYIGFSADYMKRLYTLTGDNCITIIDSKSPIYISGVGIECVFLPCCLGNDYNADNYKQFREELKACYIQDAKTKEENEKQKALKNTDKIEKEVIYNGFTLYFAGRQLFILSDKKRVTNDITNDFLKIMTDITGIDYINKITEIDYKYYKSGVQAATITKTTSYSGNEEIYRIETKYNSENFYKNEYDRLIIYNGNMEKIDICADDMSTETKEETTATIQDNAADIVADPETTNETTAADVMSATTTDKAATTETANNDSVADTNNRKRVLHGFYMTFKNRDIFVATNEDMKRRYIVQAFITEMINISNHLQNITEEKRNSILNDEDVLSETKKRITPATIEEIWTSQENHIRITTNNGNTIINQSLNDFKTIMLDCYSANEGITPAQEKSLKFFSGISRINNQLTETITQDIKADLQADNRQTETTQGTTPTQDKPHKTSNRSVSLFIVTDKPAPVKLYGANIPTLERIPTYTQRIISRFKPSKMQGIYNNRVSNINALKTDYMTFNSTVSCYNDKCAIGGKVATGNTS